MSEGKDEAWEGRRWDAVENYTRNMSPSEDRDRAQHHFGRGYEVGWDAHAEQVKPLIEKASELERKIVGRGLDADEMEALNELRTTLDALIDLEEKSS